MKFCKCSAAPDGAVWTRRDSSLITANQLRLLDAHTGHLARGGLVDWNALLGLMAGAADEGARSHSSRPCACRNGFSPPSR